MNLIHLPHKGAGVSFRLDALGSLSTSFTCPAREAGVFWVPCHLRSSSRHLATCSHGSPSRTAGLPLGGRLIGIDGSVEPFWVTRPEAGD